MQMAAQFPYDLFPEALDSSSAPSGEANDSEPFDFDEFLRNSPTPTEPIEPPTLSTPHQHDSPPVPTDPSVDVASLVLQAVQMLDQPVVAPPPVLTIQPAPTPTLASVVHVSPVVSAPPAVVPRWVKRCVPIIEAGGGRKLKRIGKFWSCCG